MATDTLQADDKSVTADFRSDADRVENLSGIVHLIDHPLVPLAKVVMLTIEAQV